MACLNGREFAPEGREALIANLEELGLDAMPGAVRADIDWRDRLADEQMIAITEIMSRPALPVPSPEEALARPLWAALRHAAAIQAKLENEARVEDILFQSPITQEAERP